MNFAFRKDLNAIIILVPDRRFPRLGTGSAAHLKTQKQGLFRIGVARSELSILDREQR